MEQRRNTPAKGLKDLHQQAMKTLMGFATSTLQATTHQWYSAENRARAAKLVTYIKRDLEEYTKRLKGIESGHKRTITSGILQQPNHPTMLAAGGEYFNFLDDVTATIAPHSLELVDLIDDDINEAKNCKAAS